MRRKTMLRDAIETGEILPEQVILYSNFALHPQLKEPAPGMVEATSTETFKLLAQGNERGFFAGPYCVRWHFLDPIYREHPIYHVPDITSDSEITS